MTVFEPSKSAIMIDKAQQDGSVFGFYEYFQYAYLRSQLISFEITVYIVQHLK